MRRHGQEVGPELSVIREADLVVKEPGQDALVSLELVVRRRMVHRERDAEPQPRANRVQRLGVMHIR